MNMTAKEFRRMALALPEVVESTHMSHPDFRVGGKIFATLGYPSRGWGMVKLTPDQQEMFIEEQPDVFEPASGAWGEQGATTVRLAAAKKGSLRPAMVAAWRNRAPKLLAQQFEAE